MDITATISVEDAWALFQADAALQAKFLEHVSAFNLDFDVALSPYWALWFARAVIADEWLMGEDLMHNDNQVWAWYTAYTDNMRECGALGWSTKISTKYKVDERGQIVADLREDQQPLLPTKRKEARTRLESPQAVADRISKQMETFQKQRKQATNDEDD